jgi:hypothetical protein
MMSGTFHRSDRGRIPFLPYHDTATGEVVDFDATDWTTIHYSRRDALRDHAILPVEFSAFEAHAVFVKGQALYEFTSFTELTTRSDQRAGLYAVLRDKGGKEIATAMLKDWLVYRRDNPTAQALIITHNQSEARNYRTWIQSQYPQIDVRIAISDEGAASTAVLKDFCRGRGEVVITVGKAYVGMDAPRISHIALLTYIRQRGWIEQAISRGVRINPDASAGSWSRQRCRVYSPRDPLLLEIIREIEADQQQAIEEQIEDEESDGKEGGGEREEMIVFRSGIDEMHAHELNMFSLTADLTGRCNAVIRTHDLTLSPGQLTAATLELMGAEPMTYQPVAPEIGQREQEEICRRALEQRCRRIDGARGAAFGTTNSAMFRHFKVGRPDMTLQQLLTANAWLDRTFPEPVP